MLNRLWRKKQTPPCVRCGQHSLARSPRQNLLERVAGIAGVYPFQCEGCRHRFLALAWNAWYLEWDGQILVMPDSDHQLRAGSEDTGEFYKFAVIFCVLVTPAVTGIAWISKRLPDYQSVIMGLLK